MASPFKKYLTLAAAALLLGACRQTQPVGQSPEAPAADVWPAVQKQTRPWTRWWWMGSAVDEKNLNNLLEQYAEAGMGGVEIAPIYGAIGHENRYLEFLSPEWMRMLGVTVQKANSVGMGVDMTLGTGWPFGGPQVTPEHAASKMIVQTYTLSRGQKLGEKIEVKDPRQRELGAKLEALTAYGEKGEVLDLRDKVGPNGQLNWTAPAGKWELYALFAGNTRQQVKRAAPGGAGLTMDHLSKEALAHYLKPFDEAFAGKSLGVRAFFNDSYEVYNADWTPGFFEEFEKRRGYDLRLHLRTFLSQEHSEEVARLKNDYRHTMGELVLEEFTQPWTNWIHQQNGVSKNQAHGSPGNLLDLYATVDIPECETFGSSYFPIPGLRRDSADIRNVDPDPIMLKFASSGANATGKPLVSCETFTWLTEHFKTSWSQAKPEVEQAFLSGVNHVFYHGTTYSPDDVAWPGWLFYASVNFVPANSLWPHLKGLNEYITRVQSVLQAGQSDNELMVYWPIHDVWHKPEGREMLIKVHDIDEWLHPTDFYQTSKQLMERGYSLDFVSDNMLAKATVTQGLIRPTAAAAGHRVLLVPQCKQMPVATLERVIQLARDGATVILQGLPEDVPGLHELESRRAQLKQVIAGMSFRDLGKGLREMPTGNGRILLARDVQPALEAAGVFRETLTDTGLKFIRQNLRDGKYYHLVNHTPQAIDTQLPLNVPAKSVVIMDPQSGRSGLGAASDGMRGTNVRVQLQPGEALILKATTEAANGLPAWKYLQQAGTPVEVTGQWNLRFTKGGPELPEPKKLNQLTSWTELGDPKAVPFSGSGEYTIEFNLPGKKAEEYLLELGQVRESARVWVNGQEVGILWSIPFRARVGQYLKPGKNTLKVEVTNLMANRIRDLDQKGIEWRKYHEINFVNIDYKPFDASRWKPMPSGLLGPVTITPYATVDLTDKTASAK